MIEKNLDYIYNLDYLIVIPSLDNELYHGFQATFNNVIMFNNNVKDFEFFQKFFKTNNLKKVIFVDYNYEYEQFISFLAQDIEIEFIYTRTLSGLSDDYNLLAYNYILDLYKSKKIKSFSLLDENFYTVLKKQNYNVKLLKLKSSLTLKETHEDTIGLLNDQIDPKVSFYNELTAISLLDKKAKVLNPNNVTKNFCQEFNIPLKAVKSYQELLNNEINLYINFTKADILPFLDSMNNGIICLLGNSNILNNYPDLKKFLVVDSDDDCNEIKEKMQIALKNKEQIFKLYHQFIQDYNQEVLKLKEEFIGIETKQDEKEYDYLLSVIIPIYNVEKYLEGCLDSISKAVIEDMEIILINDGSTDKSADIAQAFVQNHDNVRYIYQKNHGLGNVRNVGLKEAKGKYIASIDSDDTINPNFFKEAIDYLKNDVDIVIYDWLSIIPDKENFPTPALDKMLNLENNYKSILYATIMPSACNKIIKKSLYTELNLDFAELKYEDFSTNPLILLHAKKIKYINKPYYEYMIRPNSIMRNHKKVIDYDMIKVIKRLEAKLNQEVNVKINLQEFKNYTFWWRVEELIINKIYDLNEQEIKDYVKFMDDNIKSTLIELYQDNEFVNNTINKFDEETKDYIMKRNKAIINNKLAEFIINHRKDYKIITAAMILYNIDNRGENK